MKEKKFKEGTYMVFTFEAKPDSIDELERVYRITDDVIKFIVVKKIKKLNKVRGLYLK